jgi:hypothetical protein
MSISRKIQVSNLKAVKKISTIMNSEKAETASTLVFSLLVFAMMFVAFA